MAISRWSLLMSRLSHCQWAIILRRNLHMAFHHASTTIHIFCPCLHTSLIIAIDQKIWDTIEASGYLWRFVNQFFLVVILSRRNLREGMLCWIKMQVDISAIGHGHYNRDEMCRVIACIHRNWLWFLDFPSFIFKNGWGEISPPLNFIFAIGHRDGWNVWSARRRPTNIILNLWVLSLIFILSNVWQTIEEDSSLWALREVCPR